MTDFDCTVVGAGVVGLAVARECAQRGHSTLLLDRHATIGTEVSSRSSEVVHSGIYYAPGLIKARTCVRGRELLFAYCARMGVAIRACGKIIVACDATEVPKLAELQSRAAANGVTGIEWLDQAGVARSEPAVSARAALWSRDTGIVDSHGLMAALLADFETSGGVFAPRSGLAGVTRQADGSFGLRLDGSDTVVLTRHVVNSAGLGAVAVARGIEGMPPDVVPRLRYAKGHYFALSGAAPFQRLVYPVPVDGGLGVHATLDLGGRVRFGPDVEWVDSESYGVDASRAADFYGAIRRYWPGLTDGHLLPDDVGIRPKISGPGEPAADFRIDDARTHGVPGLVNLFGIESPGLTASMAIAELVAERLA